MLSELIELMPAEPLMNKDGDPYAYMTPPARLSFAKHLSNPNEDGKRVAVLQFPQGASVAMLAEAIDAAGREKFGKKYDSLDVTIALKDSDSDPKKIEKEYDGFADAKCWMQMSNIADKVDVAYLGVDGDEIDPSKFYSGCWVRARVAFKGSDYKRNSVTCYFSGIQFLCDDEEFKGESDPGAGFGAVPAAVKAKALAAKANGAATGASKFM